MGVREVLNRQQKLVVVAAGVVILGAGVYIFTQARANFGTAGPGKVYFTNDDGKTVFADDSTKLAPFDKDGKPAYRAHVFMVNGKEVVGYMERMTDRAITVMTEAKQAAAAGKPPPNIAELSSVAMSGIEIKRPGDPNWVSQSDPVHANAVRVFRLPDGSAPQEVLPK